MVLYEEGIPVSTLDEMESFKAVCSTWMDSEEAHDNGFQGKEYKELRMYRENDTIVHDMGSGDVVYVRERIRSQTQRNPGIVQDNGTVFLVHLEDTPREVEPKDVFHVVSECVTECRSAAHKSASRLSSASRISNQKDTRHIKATSQNDELHIDTITLSKYWNALISGNSSSCDWTKSSVAAANGTSEQGKHFGLMKNIYANLTSHKQNETYMIYMINQMTACDHIAQTTIDTFEKEANGTIIRPKNQMTNQEAIDGLFLGITGQDMTSMGLQAHRVNWDLLSSATSWRPGEAETKLKRELEVVDQNMANGKIAEYNDCIMYIDPILERSGMPKEYFVITKQMWEASFTKFKDDKQLFLARVRQDLGELMEGSHGQSIFASWTRFVRRVFAKPCRVSTYDEDDIAWISSSQTIYKKGKSTALAALCMDEDMAHVGGLNAFREPPSTGGLNTFRELPSASELSQIVYIPKEEAKKHAKEKCAFHAQMIRNSNSFKSSDRSEQDLMESLHTTEECLAFQNQYLECSFHQGGKDAIVHIYQTNDPAESKRRWSEAAQHVRGRVTDNSGVLNCIWHDEIEGGYLFHVGGCAAALTAYRQRV